MNEAMRVADVAAGASDRWLFVFALCALGVVMMVVARYFVAQHERLQIEHHAVMTQLMGDQVTRQEELTRVVAANTEALRAVASELRWCKERNLAAGSGRE